MAGPDYTLDLDRSRELTMREQAREAIVEAMRAGREGFRSGDRLTAVALAAHNGIHRNTLSDVMDDLVRLGYLRRLPNRGFEVVYPPPERPSQLTRQILSLSEVAERGHLTSRSLLIEDECRLLGAHELTGPLARVRSDLALAAGERVVGVARCRQVRSGRRRRWDTVALEQSFIPNERVPGFMEGARQQIESQGDFSVYRQLRRTFPNEEFFKAHYEISLAPLPAGLAVHWPSPSPLMCVIAITYCSQGPVEWTRTWFDTNRAVLLAGSLDVRLDGATG